MHPVAHARLRASTCMHSTALSLSGILRGSSDANSMLRCSACRRELGHLEGAVADLQAALQLQPQNTEAASLLQQLQAAGAGGQQEGGAS